MHGGHRSRRPRRMESDSSSCKNAPADDHAGGLGPSKAVFANIINDDIGYGVVLPDALQRARPQNDEAPVNDEAVKVSCRHDCLSSNEAESIFVGGRSGGECCSGNGDISIAPIKQVLYCNQAFQDVMDLAVKSQASTISDNGPTVEPAADVTRVFERFENGSGQSRARIVRVERVQNDWLWTRYCSRREEAKLVNERYLWCGLNTVNLGNVVVRGFGALGIHRGPLFVANTALALHNAEEEEGQLQQMLVSAAAVEPTATAATVPTKAGGLVPKPPDIQLGLAADATRNHSEAATTAAATETSLQGLLYRFKIPWLSSSVKHVDESPAPPTVAAPSPAVAAALQQAQGPQPLILVQPPLQRQIITTASMPYRVPSPDFPGKSGAVLLCRVVLGHMAIGIGDGHELPPDADSAMDMKMMAASMEKRNTTAALVAGEKRALQSDCGAAEDLAWSMRGAYADDLAVVLRCAAMQAYPEFIVHID
ncbi:hypothetical protein Vretifemale_18800 [Volvox reticuliferus]|uniref:Uncharacterized protein n=1 Tax=Volvox reticuliferus TaxID=1737510 RepID=A0A8J4CWC1_9CHLO|nr:hypothetical protein Vretifemale_18800 [Volvox reticuliferus]